MIRGDSMAYMCLGCYEIYDRDLGHCPKSICNCMVAEIDELMIPTIKLLNLKGYITEFCCSGHPYDDGCTSYVLLDNIMTSILGEELIEEIKRTLPASWKIEIDEQNRIHFSHEIRMDENCKNVIETYEDILKANLEFLHFVKQLPELEY